MRRPPNQLARWVSTHPVLGALVLGPLFAAIIAANSVWISDVHLLVAAIGLVILSLYGPLMAWVIRRNVERWDATHRN